MKIAIDLGGTNIRVGQVENGEVIHTTIKPCPSKKSCSEVLSFLIEMIDSEMIPQTEGIGIGVPSVVDASKGIVYNVANIPSWKEVHLKEILEERFNVPVFVNNDANCFALGEKLFGKGVPYSNLIGITLGTGVGAGVVLDGKLYNGSHTGAGEIGSLPYLNKDFEYYCSSGIFADFYKMSGKDVFDRAREGDKEALAIWSEIGTHIGNLLKAVLYTYDPDAIVLGGGISAAYPFFSESMKQTISCFPYQNIVDDVEIFVSEEKNISLLGASALVV
ncbi:ROK family protein [Bacteroides sedimenti]|uniref:Sugar kinase n=1 Tax=Bacteroides sedimenti TaxID=2136147 RepID=A0ABN6Z984_9BACE